MKRFWQSLLMVVWVSACMPAHAALHEVVVLTQASGGGREAERERAMTLAKAQAIGKVARTLNPAKAQEYLKTLDATSMLPLVRGATVLEETRLNDVYYAKVRVSVQDTPIREAYGEQVDDAKLLAEKPRRAILVLPVFFNGVEPVVWDVKTNPTFEMWREAGFGIGKGALLIPSGDPKERAIVDRDNALTVKYEYLKPLLESYGTDEIAVVVVSEVPDAKLADPVEVVIRRVREEGQKIERLNVSPDALPDGKFPPRTELYKEAVKRTAKRLARVTESTAHLEAKAKLEAKQQNILVQFTTLKDWAMIEKHLRAAEGFVAMDTLSIGINNAVVILYIKDDVAKARAGLSKAGLIVADVDGVWRIRSR